MSAESYGILHSTSAPSGPVGQIIESLQVRGFAVIPDALAMNQVDDLNERLDDVYLTQCNEVGGEASLLNIVDSDIVRCPLAYDSAFLDLAVNPLITSVAREALGQNIVLLMQNGIINRPNRPQPQTRWHRDLNYQHWVSSKPLAISALACLEDFTVETGGTVFLPASHKFKDFPSLELVEIAAVFIEARKGSIIVFDSMVFHRAGVNQSSRIRRGINHVIGAPILTQQICIPSMLAQPPPDDPWLAGYLGYRWNPVSSVRDWRLRKLHAA